MNNFAFTGMSLLLLRVATIHKNKKEYNWATACLERMANHAHDAKSQGIFKCKENLPARRRRGRQKE